MSAFISASETNALARGVLDEQLRTDVSVRPGESDEWADLLDRWLTKPFRHVVRMQFTGGTWTVSLGGPNGALYTSSTRKKLGEAIAVTLAIAAAAGER